MTMSTEKQEGEARRNGPPQGGVTMDNQIQPTYHGRRVVVKTCGPARETLRLFALFCKRRPGMTAARVGR